MTRRILVSRGLPSAALGLIPPDVDVDYNGFEQALSKAELLSRLKGRHGLICQIVDTVDDEVLATEGLRVVCNVAVGYNNLVRALSEGWIAGAGLDVFEEEPRIHPGLPPLKNVVLAPHIASGSSQTRLAMGTLAVRNCLAVLDGTPALTPVII